MYVPAHFAMTDDQVRELLRTCEMGELVTHGEDGLHATPLPWLYDEQAGPLGTLVTHVARTNPQWQHVNPQVGSGAGARTSEAMVLVRGPDQYVSPGWLPSKAEKSGASKKDEKDDAQAPRSTSRTRGDDREGPTARIITLSKTKDTERSSDSDEPSTSRTDEPSTSRTDERSGSPVRGAPDTPAAVVRTPAKARTSIPSAEESDAPEQDSAEQPPAEPQHGRGPANETQTPAPRETPEPPAQTAPSRPAPAPTSQELPESGHPTNSRPSPGTLKIVSIKNEPVRRPALIGPMMVTTGISEFLSTCRRIMIELLSPFARAVRT